MSQGLGIGQIVDRNHFEGRVSGNGSQKCSADTAKTIDGQPNRTAHF
jgi:hypothetical protein